MSGYRLSGVASDHSVSRSRRSAASLDSSYEHIIGAYLLLHTWVCHRWPFSAISLFSCLFFPRYFSFVCQLCSARTVVEHTDAIRSTRPHHRNMKIAIPKCWRGKAQFPIQKNPVWPLTAGIWPRLPPVRPSGQSPTCWQPQEGCLRAAPNVARDLWPPEGNRLTVEDIGNVVYGENKWQNLKSWCWLRCPWGWTLFPWHYSDSRYCMQRQSISFAK